MGSLLYGMQWNCQAPSELLHGAKGENRSIGFGANSGFAFRGELQAWLVFS